MKTLSFRGSSTGWIVLCAFLFSLQGCARHSQDIKRSLPEAAPAIVIGEMLPGKLISRKDGSAIHLQVEVIALADIDFRMTAYDPGTGENFQGRGSVIFPEGGDAAADGREGAPCGGCDPATHGLSGKGMASKDCGEADEAGVLFGDKGTIIKVWMKANCAFERSQLRAYGEARDNKGNKYLVRI